MKSLERRTTIYFDPEVHKALRFKAAESETPISALVNEILKKKLIKAADNTADKLSTATKIKQIQKAIIPVLKRAGVKKAGIFGSFARGEDTPESDIDILVTLPNGTTLFDYVGLKSKLEEAVGREVDLVEYGAVKPVLKPYIFKDAVSIL